MQKLHCISFGVTFVCVFSDPQMIAYQTQNVNIFCPDLPPHHTPYPLPSSYNVYLKSVHSVFVL